MTNKSSVQSRHFFLAFVVILLSVLAALFIFPRFGSSVVWNAPAALELATTTIPIFPTPPRVTHRDTPDPVRALYMTACVAGVPSLRSRLIALATATEINALVIDIKDYSGAVFFPRENQVFNKPNPDCSIVNDMREFVNELHDNDIYVIGRVTVFQDPHFAGAHPELAVQKKDGTVWRDRKGLAFVDVSAREYWDEIAALSMDAYAIGFDEINFDYIRFPSDGNMQDIKYPLTGTTTKAVALKNFFSYLHDSLEGTGIVTSADLFGMTTSNTDDLGIGQVLENTLPYFDYVAPMVYPSHYPPGFDGHANPAAVPYEIITYAMQKGIERTEAASSTPTKLRAWLQDFNLGAVYTPELVRKQKQALYDLGLTSWMMWDPKNVYTRGALDETP